MKKNTAKTNQLPKALSGNRFINWFPHGWNFIEADRFETNHPKISNKSSLQKRKKAKKSEKLNTVNKPKWRTETDYPIEPVVLWHRWKDPQDLVGVSFDTETRYAVADIDIDSPLHPNNNKKAFYYLLASFEDIGLVAYVIIRSSFSNGLHIYIPLPKKTGTFNLACALDICAKEAGVKVKSGELEFFPNVKSYSKNNPTAYKAHRLPLQPHTGSVILDHDLNPIGDSPDLFCDQMEWAAARQDMNALDVACNLGREIINFRRMGSRSKARLAKFKQDLEIMIAEGWTDCGQTNFLLGKIAAYGMIFTEHQGEDLADYIARTAQSCDGYREYCHHQHDIKRRARDYAKSAERYYWKPGTPCKRAGTYQQNFYKTTNPNHNQEIAETAQSRIVGGLNNLLQAGINLTVTGIVAFRDALREEIHKLYGVGVSNSTLIKYRKLWHPKDKGIILGTKPPFSNTSELESEPVQTASALVEPGDIEEQINKPIRAQKHTKTSLLEELKPNQINGCTHLVPQNEKNGELKPNQINGCTHLPLYEGLVGSEMRIGDCFLYFGEVVGGLIDIGKSQAFEMRRVYPNDIVKLVSTYHSSDLRDEPPLKKIVYVQPIEQAKFEHWEDNAGIAVFLDHLKTLDS